MSETAHVSSGNPVPSPATPFRRAHVIVVGNEKGGSGKTTTTMHLIVALLRLGFTVGSLDIDSRQRSLTRYIENRRQTIANEGVALPTPQHFVIQKSPFDSMEEAKADEKERFAKGLAKIYGTCDFVVIDTPGNDTFLSRLAHSFATTVITPINDSFVDLDVLASVDGASLRIVKPSIYSEMVWEQKLQRAKRDGGSIDWIVMRNRLSHLDARNKRFMAQVTEELSRRIGFRVAPGFSERVIFREMFLQGLTVLDVLETEGGGEPKLSISHVAARQEVRQLLAVLKIPEIDRRIEKLRVGDVQLPAAASVAETVSAEALATAEIARAATAGANEPPENGKAFAIAGQQKLPPAAELHAQAELARATIQLAPKSALRAGYEASPAAKAGMQTAGIAAAVDPALYPVRPTPSLASASPETRPPLPAAPVLPSVLAETAIDALRKPAPVLGSDPVAADDMRPLPSVPRTVPEIDIARIGPALHLSPASVDEAKENAARLESSGAGVRVFSGALN